MDRVAKQHRLIEVLLHESCDLAGWDFVRGVAETNEKPLGDSTALVGRAYVEGRSGTLDVDTADYFFIQYREADLHFGGTKDLRKPGIQKVREMHLELVPATTK